MKGRILVFDDDRIQLNKIYIELLLQNYEVEVTSNPDEIISRASRIKPDMAIVNYDLKDCCVSDICIRIKRDLGIPIAFLIDKVTTEKNVITCCEPDAFIDKPVSSTQLLEVISSLMNAGK